MPKDAQVWVERAGAGGALFAAEQVSISLADRGFWYGDGLFETMRVSSGHLPLLHRHLRRLQTALDTLGFGPLGLSAADLAARCESVVAANGTAHGYLRLALSRGDGRRGFLPPDSCQWLLLIQSGDQTPHTNWATIGMRAALAPWRVDPANPACRVKSLSALDKVMARREAARLGVDELLFRNMDGWLTEGAMTNLFVVRDGALLTPAADCGLLPGIARELIMELAAGAGYEVREAWLTPVDLRAADEALLCNALIGVAPLVSLDGASISADGRPGPVTTRLRQLYEQKMTSP